MAIRRVKNGTLTSSTSSVVLPLTGSGSGVLVTIYGTYGSLSFAFYGSSDGTNYTPVEAVKSDTLSNVVGTISPADNSTLGWYIHTAGLTHVKVLASALTSGTVNVSLVEAPGQFPVVEAGVYNIENNNVAKQTVAVAAGGGTGNVVAVSSGPGILHRFTVTTAGTAAFTIYDNATTNSGNVLYVSAATPALGLVVELNFPFSNGLTIAQASGSAAITIGYSLT